MSQLSAAAEAMGVPEPLVERSANAWATAQGQSVDDVLAAWAGGEAVASAPAPTDETAEPDTEAPDTESPATEAPAEAAPTEEAPPPARPAAQPTPQPAAAAAGPRDARPPILDAPPDHPLVSVLGGVAVMALVILLGFVFPSLPTETDEVRSSDLPFTTAAVDGRAVYQSAGCASCHTQFVRSVVADVNVGAVTLTDTDQVLGYRRIGPDLSDVGSRLDPAQILATVTGSSHPTLPLSADSVDALVTYLSESATSPPGSDEESEDGAGGEEGEPEEGDAATGGEASEEGAES